MGVDLEGDDKILARLIPPPGGPALRLRVVGDFDRTGLRARHGQQSAEMLRAQPQHQPIQSRGTRCWSSKGYFPITKGPLADSAVAQGRAGSPEIKSRRRAGGWTLPGPLR